jgi:hypothetical protein
MAFQAWFGRGGQYPLTSANNPQNVTLERTTSLTYNIKLIIGTKNRRS